jgi:hypothetical protein
MVRIDTLFTERFIRYYGAAFGPENLFIMLDGHDQQPPDPVFGVNILRLPFKLIGVIAAEKRRALTTSNLAAASCGSIVGCVRSGDRGGH